MSTNYGRWVTWIEDNPLEHIEHRGRLVFHNSSGCVSWEADDGERMLWDAPGFDAFVRALKPEPEEEHMHEAFQVHMLTDEGKAKATELAESFDALLAKVTAMIPAGRELSLVTTKLEEASFFAKKGMAKHHSQS